LQDLGRPFQAAATATSKGIDNRKSNIQLPDMARIKKQKTPIKKVPPKMLACAQTRKPRADGRPHGIMKPKKRGNNWTHIKKYKNNQLDE
jgi:hypothetical protein